MKQKLLFLLFFIPFVLISQSKLGNAKDSLSKRSSSGTTSSSSSSSRSSNNHGFFDDFFAQILYDITLGIGIGDAEYREMSPYPYYYDKQGEYIKDFDNNMGKRSSFRVGTNYVINRINSFEVNAVFKPIPLIGIEASHLNFSEQTLFNSESLNISSIMLNYYRFREQYFSVWWGFGATYIGNEVDTWGGTFSVGTEIYPVKPISLHISWKRSFINEGKVDIFKSQVKYHLKKTALYTGYHNYQLGSETVSGLVLGLEYIF